MRRAWYGGVALALAAVVLVPATLAGRRGGKMAEALDLTAEQRTQMSAVFEKYRSGEMGERRREMREARGELRSLIHDASATDAQVEEAARRVASLSVGLAVERHRMAIEMDRILTEEQKEKAAALRQDRRHGRHGAPEIERDTEEP